METRMAKMESELEKLIDMVTKINQSPSLLSLNNG